MTAELHQAPRQYQQRLLRPGRGISNYPLYTTWATPYFTQTTGFPWLKTQTSTPSPRGFNSDKTVTQTGLGLRMQLTQQSLCHNPEETQTKLETSVDWVLQVVSRLLMQRVAEDTADEEITQSSQCQRPVSDQNETTFINSHSYPTYWYQVLEWEAEEELTQGSSCILNLCCNIPSLCRLIHIHCLFRKEQNRSQNFTNASLTTSSSSRGSQKLNQW